MSISATSAASCAYHPSFSPSKHNNNINMQSLQLQKEEKYHYQKKDGQHSDDNCLRDTSRSVTTTSLLAKEDVTFLFSSMTWNVDLLEVLLAKAPNPMYSGMKPEENKKITTVIEQQPSLSAVAAFPSLEEALMEAATTTATATAKNNKNSHQNNNNNNKKKNGNHNRRSKRRKVRRGRTIELRLPFVTSISEEREDFGDEEDDYEEQEEIEIMKDNTHAVTTNLRNTCDVRPIKESYSTYTTEEEDSDTGFVPHRCLEVRKTSLSSESPDGDVVVVGVPLISNISKNDDVFSTEITIKNEEKQECLKNDSMRDFLRQFYQSFILVVAAQVRQDQQKANISQSRSLSSLEYRALCFVRHHMMAFKELVRNYVMCGEKEAERRGAQPLLVGRFDCERLEGIEDWAPPHAQVYIAGKEPASQPLLLEILHITRVLQCYAEPQTLVQQPHDNTHSTRNTTRPRDIASDALYYWRRLLLERPNGCNERGMTNDLFFSNEEWEFAYELFTNSLSPLVWTPYTTFGPYMVYSSQLPYTNRHITKLVLPAEDRNSYDLSAHFQEGVFRFLHGTPLFPIDEFSQDFDMDKQRFFSQSSLLHCSAGMHRSSGIAIAYLLWLVALSHGKLPSKITSSPSTTTTTKTAATSAAAAAAIQVKRGDQQEQKQKQEKQNKEQRATPSYLSAVLRNQKERQNVLDCSVSAGAAVGTTEEEEEKVNYQDAAGANSVVEENISIERSCMEHVRQQRSMALPITAVQQQLLHYACHLHLH